jgi:hypothetical protein
MGKVLTNPPPLFPHFLQRSRHISGHGVELKFAVKPIHEVLDTDKERCFPGETLACPACQSL